MDEQQSTQPVRSLIPWRSGMVYVIMASSLMGVMGVSMISPVLPQLRPVFGVSDAQVGLIITVYTLPGVFITPVIGLLADRLGRKTILVPLLFTFGIAGAAMAFTTSFSVLLGLRFLQGVGASALVMLSITLIGDVYEGPTRRTLIGVNASLISTGAAIYPLIGGILAIIAWQVPFLFFGIGILVGVYAIFVLEEPDSGDPLGTREYFSHMYRAVRVREAIAIFVAIFSIFFVFYGAVITAMPLLLSDEYGLTAGEIGLVISMVALASAGVSSQYGRISRYQSAPQLVALGFVAYGSSLLFVWIAPNVVFIGAGLLAFGVGFGIVMPSVETAIMTLVSEDLRAGMMGLRTSLIRLGQTTGPVAFTFSAEAFFVTTVEGYYTLMLLAGLVLVGCGCIAYVFLRNQ